MAIYFLAMYALGASLGPLATGWLSDHFAGNAALSAGVSLPAAASVIEPFKALGLLRAMYVIPIFGAALALVLFAGSRTVAEDIGKLHAWLRRIEAE